MIRLFNRYWSKAAVVSLLAEASMLFAGVWIAYHVRFWGKYGLAPTDLDILIRSAAFVAVVLLTCYLSGLYDFEEYHSPGQLTFRLVRSLTFAALALGAVYYAVPYLFLGRGLLAISLISSFMLIAGWRVFLTWVLKRSVFSQRILIVGSDEASRELAQEIMERSHLGYRVQGFVADDPELQGMSLVNPKVLGTTDEVFEVALANQVSRVLVAQKDRRGRLNLDALLQCKTRGIPVEQGGEFYERLTGKISLEGLRIKSWLIFSKGFVVSPTALFFKRALDLVAAGFAIVLALPVMALTALAVRLDSRGPIFFKQERLGRDGKPFTLYKFRSMRVDAEKAGEAIWAVKGDSRVTRVGKVVRKFRFDELPQLWNVLRGDMSLVGPRPEREQFVDQLTEACPLYRQRLAVRPGLTGWAQIKAPYAATVEQSIDKLQYDLYYIKNLSIFLDLSILASTLRAVLLGRGAQ